MATNSLRPRNVDSRAEKPSSRAAIPRDFMRVMCDANGNPQLLERNPRARYRATEGRCCERYSASEFPKAERRSAHLPESVARFIFVTTKSHGNMGKHDKDTTVKTAAFPSHADNRRDTRETEYYFIPQNTQRSLSKFYRRSTPIREIFHGHCCAAGSPAMQRDP